MSENLLILIPFQPDFIPAQESQRAATAILREMVAAESIVESRTTAFIEFVDAGANFKSIACPLCRREIDTAWWSGAMDAAARSEFSDLGIVTPCCHKNTSLNDLVYDFPQGFARFRLQAINPHIPGLEGIQLSALEQALGCNLRVIWQHL